MKRVVFVAVVALLGSAFASEIFREGDPYDGAFYVIERNTDGIIIYEDFDGREEFYNPRQTFGYKRGKFEQEGKFRYATMYNTRNMRYTEGRCLVLMGEDSVLVYDSDGTPKYYAHNPWLNGFFGDYFFHLAAIEKGKVRVSSFLTEGKKQYSAENLIPLTWDDALKLASPWVEGVEGYGIGEYFEISSDYIMPGEWDDKTHIYISIGYVSYNNPELYEQNSRPKSFDIFIGKKFWKTIELQDTPDPQRFELPGKELLSKGGDVRFVIKDVYKGTKYDDTCINFIYFTQRSNTGYKE